jgi:hypothetical protein
MYIRIKNKSVIFYYFRGLSYWEYWFDKDV